MANGGLSHSLFSTTAPPRPSQRGKKRTQNAKGPNLSCQWGLILNAGGVKQNKALLGGAKRSNSK